jgi:hypothetical protein
MTKGKRFQAIRLGVVEIDRAKCVRILRLWRPIPLSAESIRWKPSAHPPAKLWE